MRFFYKMYQCRFQGSILGPILFLVHVNDSPNVSILLQLVLFEDDTTVSISASSEETVDQPVVLTTTSSMFLDKIDSKVIASFSES